MGLFHRPINFGLAMLWKKERHMAGREEIECRKLRRAAGWLKKMEQRYAKQRKEVQARYRKLYLEHIGAFNTPQITDSMGQQLHCLRA